jgi:hypothetical protein
MTSICAGCHETLFSSYNSFIYILLQYNILLCCIFLSCQSFMDYITHRVSHCVGRGLKNHGRAGDQEGRNRWPHISTAETLNENNIVFWANENNILCYSIAIYRPVNLGAFINWFLGRSLPSADGPGCLMRPPLLGVCIHIIRARVGRVWFQTGQTCLERASVSGVRFPTPGDKMSCRQASACEGSIQTRL